LQKKIARTGSGYPTSVLDAGRRPLVLISGKDVREEVGGHPSYVRAHALAGLRLGFAPRVFCFGPRNRLDVEAFGTVHTVAAPLGVRLPVALQQTLLARSVATFLASRRGSHLIHGFAIWSAAGVAASARLARSGVPATPVASAYGTRAYEVGVMQNALGPRYAHAERARYRAWLRWIRLVDDRVERRGYSRARLVLVNYESVSRLLIASYGDALQIRWLPYAAPGAFAESEAGDELAMPAAIAHLTPKHAPLVVAVSRHDPRKGVDQLLLALARVHAARLPVRGCIIGPGRLLEAHRKLVADLGLGAAVAVPGRVDDVRPYLQQADVFVLPSWGEASGSVSVLEALQSGTPVIATACDGIPEDLLDGVDALLVQPGDPAGLADALMALLADPAHRAVLAAGSRRAYERKFSAEAFTVALGAMYAELGFTP
jgi:glycosyltransferase involved in cell wall biosynthesis